ncbi:leucine-rich repeat domain-containing protein [Tenacibaculum aiptasiae]|uniref:Leucine-rich repeat domain-containing protein n=1 Tax=Tenacibaculum aiptasiae TaxID=426481 RepID=A0A7J5ALE6_9FLAO|nr:leucine-rich repeat domain-containing protein [Tenacibaculum aiptasiae]KAB1158310.1 leucine-rich repeat domain-containing protein [Tenacibaculum aiptasiae]
MSNYKENISSYIHEALIYLKKTKNLWIKEDHPEIIERLENWDWKTDLIKIEQRLQSAYKKILFEENIGTIAINWDDYYNNGVTLYFGSESEYQEWGDDDWLDWEIDLTDIINQIFGGIDKWYNEMEIELDLFKELFLGLVETAAIHSIKTKEFKQLKKHDTYLISSALWHDSEYDMIFNSKEPVVYKLSLREEYKKTIPEALEKGYYAFFGEKHNISTKWIRSNGSKEGVIPEEIGLFQNAEEIKAKNEYLKDLPDTLFSLSKLKDLDLSHNKLKSISQNITKLQNLNVFDISNNHLSHLPNELAELAELKRLNIEYNQLTKLPPLEKLPKLDSLSAHNNNIEEFSELPQSLTWLNLNSNELEQLPKSITNLKNLKTLVISNNSFHSVPKELLQLTSLESIELGGNPLEDLPKELLSLPKLREVRVIPNKFSIEKRKELREAFGDILFVGFDSDANSFM